MRSVLLIIAVAFMSVACGKVPSNYLGTYVDTQKGAKLELGANEWNMKLLGGREIKNKSEDMSFEVFQKAQAGVYTRDNPQNKELVDVFWVAPRAGSRQEGGGIVWFESEVIYTLLDKNQGDKVNTLHLFHCTNGTVMLDLITQKIQMGCPANPIEYNMKRTED